LFSTAAQNQKISHCMDKKLIIATASA